MALHGHEPHRELWATGGDSNHAQSYTFAKLCQVVSIVKFTSQSLFTNKTFTTLSCWFCTLKANDIWYSSHFNCPVTSKRQETHLFSVSNLVPDGEISLENVWYIIGTQNFWKECIDKIPLASLLLPPMLVAWIWGICGRVKYMSILFSSEAQLSLCSLCLPVHKTFPVHLETEERTPPVCTWNLQLLHLWAERSGIHLCFLVTVGAVRFDLKKAVVCWEAVVSSF